MARLAQHGAHVYLCARSRDRGEAAVAGIRALYPSARVTLLLMDHMSLASVVAAAQRVLSAETALHGLVNNAGIMGTPFELSPDGFEAQWQTNYLAHWVLTARLMPLLLKTSTSSPGLPRGTVRVVNVSSSGHYLSAPKDGIHFADTALRDGADAMARYGQSKLANVLHAKTLHAAHGPGSPSAAAGRGEVWTSVVHPGLVASNLGASADLPKLLLAAVAVFKAVGGVTDCDRGSWTSVFCAASPEFKSEQSGTYFQRIARPGRESKLAKDAELARKLEEWTRERMVEGGWAE